MTSSSASIAMEMLGPSSVFLSGRRIDHGARVLTIPATAEPVVIGRCTVMTDRKPQHPPPSAKASIEEARVARLEQQAARIATHLRVVLSRLNSRTKRSRDGE